MKNGRSQRNIWILKTIADKGKKKAEKQFLSFGMYIENLIKKDLEK